MLGPSGFFLPSGPENADSASNDLELIHTSKDGFNELYRICKSGRFFVYKALKKEYQQDAVHPNKEGYLVMEKVIQKILKK